MNLGKRLILLLIFFDRFIKTQAKNLTLKDVIKFGFSSREYVLLHEESKNDLDSEDEDDIKEESLIEASEIKKEKPSRPASPKKLSPLQQLTKTKHKTSYSSGSSNSGSDSEDDNRHKKKLKTSRK